MRGLYNITHDAACGDNLMSFYSFMHKMLRPLVMKLYRIETRGLENLPSGGYILAPNHTSFADVFLVSAAANLQVRYMAKKELFSTPIAPLIKAAGAFPVNRGGADVKSIKTALALIESGEVVCMFPQGHRNPGVNPLETEIKPGIGFMAYHTKAVVVPVFLDSKKLHTACFRRNTVIFGRPLSFDDLGFTGCTKPDYSAAAHIIMEKACELKYGKPAVNEESVSLSPDGKYITLPEKDKEKVEVEIGTD